MSHHYFVAFMSNHHTPAPCPNLHPLHSSIPPTNPLRSLILTRNRWSIRTRHIHNLHLLHHPTLTHLMFHRHILDFLLSNKLKQVIRIFVDSILVLQHRSIERFRSR